VPAVLRESGASSLWLNRRYAPGERRQDERVADAVEALGASVHSFAGSLLHEPGDLTTADGERFSVFSPFWRAFLRTVSVREPLPAPRSLHAARPPRSERLDDLGLLPSTPDWSAGLRETWLPGERGAQRRLEEFVEHRLKHYDEGRDLPAAEASSRLSPHLKFGEVSPYSVWHAVQAASAGPHQKERFLSELGWREFNYDTLATHAELATVNVHRAFDAFPWAEVDPARLRAWQRGRTGIPFVDAGMRQLWNTGWMHNRARMVTASFLIKNLRYDWRIGEQWFWDTLVDADPANNTAQWQWVAGSGADAAPFFRVFNPVLQARKFDPEGEYVHRWVPELRGLSGKALEEPWNARDGLMLDGGDPTEGYPAPIVDLKRSRDEALAAFEQVRQRG
jgi:deoxyribodipyrimidine photo-lyase